MRSRHSAGRPRPRRRRPRRLIALPLALTLLGAGALSAQAAMNATTPAQAPTYSTTVPLPVTGLSVTVCGLLGGVTGVSVSWTASGWGRLSDYQVVRTGASTDGPYTLPLSASSWSETSLPAEGRTYTYTVTAQTDELPAGGISPWAASASVPVAIPLLLTGCQTF